MTVLLPILKWNQIKNGTIKIFKGDFPGGPVVKTLPSTAWGMGLMLGQGTKHSTCLKKKKKKMFKEATSLKILLNGWLNQPGSYLNLGLREENNTFSLFKS